MRKRIFEIIELSDENDRAGRAYDCFMMAVIVASLIPLAFKGTNTVFMLIEKMSVVVFVADYILRLITADYKTGKSLGGGICFCTISIYADGIDRYGGNSIVS